MTLERDVSFELWQAHFNFINQMEWDYELWECLRGILEAIEEELKYGHVRLD